MTKLRHRRIAPEEKMAEEKEVKALLLEEEKSTNKPSAKTQHTVDTADGYSIVPLGERWILSRLDVGPFLLCYLFLVALDFYNDAEDHQTTMTRAFSQLLFPLVLLAHFAVFLLQQWDVFWRAAVGYKRLSMSSAKTQWTHFLVEAPHVDKHHSAHDAEIVAIQHETNVVFCSFQDMIFRCSSEETDVDIALWSSDDSSPLPTKSEQQSFQRLRYPVHLPLSFYQKWAGHVSLPDLVQAQRLYGSNTTPIRLPPFLEMLQEQLVAPFFLFQVLCVLLWCLDEYWYYAVFTFFALLMFESTVAYNRLKSLERIRSHTLNGHEKMVWAYRPAYPPGENGWVKISTSEFVPGDIVSCKEAMGRTGRKMTAQQKQQLNRVPADILILSGDVVVDESLLTGESVPQLKTALEDNSDRFLDLQEHKQSILFGGTNLLVCHPGDATMGPSQIPIAPDQGVLGMVLRTGFETAQGSLLRTMAHTQKSVDGIHTKDTYVFILLLLLCAITSAYMVWQEGWADESRNKFRLVLHVIMIVTSVVPPELPMELSLAVTNSVTDLMKRCQVYCTEIFRIPIAGQVNICCFDKTGTLTSDEMQLKGVRLVNEDNDFGDLVVPGASMPWAPTFVMAACHSLAQRGDGNSNVIGDPLEKAVMKNTGYKLVHNHLLQKEEPTPGHPDTITIMHRFGFTSRLKRMTVLAREDSTETVWALTKGTFFFGLLGFCLFFKITFRLTLPRYDRCTRSDQGFVEARVLPRKL
jgi:cation-transporting ATPase 13A1